MGVIKSILKFAVKAFASLILIGVVVSTSIYGFRSYQARQELSWLTSDICEEHSSIFQLCRASVDSVPYLRHIDRDKQVVTVSELVSDEDGEFSSIHSVYWITDCEVDTAIETGKRFSNGDPVLASCIESPAAVLNGFSTALRVGVQYVSASAGKNISYNFGGFSSDIDFSSADYSPLEQAITLQQARPLSEIEEERLAAAARAEEERIAAAARAEEERLAAAARAEEERIAAAARAEEERIAAAARAEEERLAAAARAEVAERARAVEREMLARVAQCEREEDSRQENELRKYNAEVSRFRRGDSIETRLITTDNWLGWRTEYWSVRVTNNTDYPLLRAEVQIGYTSSSSCPSELGTSSDARRILSGSLRAGASIEEGSVTVNNPGRGAKFCSLILSSTFAPPVFLRRSCD